LAWFSKPFLKGWLIYHPPGKSTTS
jgi:hypothetical protein